MIVMCLWWLRPIFHISPRKQQQTPADKHNITTGKRAVEARDFSHPHKPALRRENFRTLSRTESTECWIGVRCASWAALRNCTRTRNCLLGKTVVLLSGAFVWPTFATMKPLQCKTMFWGQQQNVSMNFISSLSDDRWIFSCPTKHFCRATRKALIIIATKICSTGDEAMIM